MVAVLLGLLYGCTLTFLAFSLGGGGHGWNSAMISGAGLFLLPAVAVAWVQPDRPTSQRIAVAVIVCVALTDLAILVATAREGIEYVVRVWSVAPLLLLGWLVLLVRMAVDNNIGSCSRPVSVGS